MKILIILGLAAIFVLALVHGQHKMIYYPRSYPDWFKLPGRVTALEYATSQGNQTAYYWPPGEDNDSTPSSLWLMFAGNASLALEWEDFLEVFPDLKAGFLLVDYPGYGKCQGRASPEAILESTEKAVRIQVAKIGTNVMNINVMGHSLGAAVALLYASRHQVNRIVLISPFTSLEDMARLAVGSPLNKALVQNYDNRIRLREIVSLSDQPDITILHGDRDEVVPVEMGRELAEISSDVNFKEIAGGKHNNIFSIAEGEILKSMIGSTTDSVPGKVK